MASPIKLPHHHNKINGYPSPSTSSSFIALLILFLFYSSLLLIARRSIYSMYVTPLPSNASLGKFSEGRTMKHIWHLAHDIGIRQEGSAGLVQASNYIKSELETYKQRSSANMRVEIDTALVNGSFSMIFLKHSITLAYRNHTNIAVRISAVDADENAPAVLVNGHFDSPIGSPGAGDCASCVASMLEAVRLIIDTDWIPPQPIIFLFNGAEELFMVACHGFMTTHKWRSTIGALINLEASGTGGPDLVCQSGPGSWPAEVYAKAAIYPMANTIAQDIFPYIPGDTDYRMFSEDYGDIPGLDIILLLEGYVYHTPHDIPERMVPGSMQMRGENLMSLLNAFTRSPNLRNSQDRAELKNQTIETTKKRAVFFDFLGWFMVYYDFDIAIALHTLPVVLVLTIVSLTDYKTYGIRNFSEKITFILKGALLHILEMVLGIVCPVIFAVIRLLPSSTAMTWFAQPWLACLTYGPISFAGILIPRFALHKRFINKKNSIGPTDMKSINWGIQWGTIFIYSVGAAVGTYFVGNGCSQFYWTIWILAAYYILQVFQWMFGKHSIITLALYLSALVIPILLSLYSAGVLWQVVEEKMGMSGSVPQPLGFFVPDIIMAAMTGFTIVSCVGPIIPMVGQWLSSRHIIQFLILLGAISSIITSQSFPYNSFAPKRILLQHTIETKGNEVLQSHFDVGLFDANSLQFVFKHIPAVSNHMKVMPNSDMKALPRSPGDTWMALYPISQLFVESFRFPASSTNILENHPILPQIIVLHSERGQHKDSQRTYVEIELGSVNEVWAAVLNITGPLLNWSFTDGLPAPETADGGPPSYICRLSGTDTRENWKFWLEARKAHLLRVDLAVLDQELEQEIQELVGLFPDWTATIAASSYHSFYII